MEGKKLLLIFLALIVLISTASAKTCIYGYATSEIVFDSPQYVGACARFSWTITDATDFTTYVVYSSRNTTDFNTNVSTYDVCTVDEADIVTIYVTPIDQNVLGEFCGATAATAGDTNAPYEQSFTPPSYVGGAKLMVYSIFTIIAALIGVLVLVGVVVFIINKFGMKRMLKK